MNESRQPVTRDVLREELSRYPTREELRHALDEALERYVTNGEFSGFVQLMIQEQERSARRHDHLIEMISATDQRIVASEQRLMVEIGRAARVAAEEHRRELGVLDDRYRDLPGRVVALERDLREHVEDAAAHGRPRRPTRRR